MDCSGTSTIMPQYTNTIYSKNLLIKSCGQSVDNLCELLGTCFPLQLNRPLGTVNHGGNVGEDNPKKLDVSTVTIFFKITYNIPSAKRSVPEQKPEH
jgi:hypothetical protein